MNPFIVSFGQIPKEYVPRYQQSDVILKAFLHEDPAQHVYIITGVRGSGKTVFMTETANKIKEEADWTVIDLVDDGDLIGQLAGALSENHLLQPVFQAAKIDLSFLNLGVHIEGATPVRSKDGAVQRMLESMQKHGKKLLITLDEAVNTESLRVFTGYFQKYLRNDLPVYFLLTGLFENIYSLQNEKNLTFLYRAPKLELNSLNVGAMTDKYQTIFSCNREQALEMAKLTKGYSFAFQALGSLTWDNGGDYVSIIPKYRQWLEEYSYEKIWSELSATDQKVLYTMASMDAEEEQIRVKDLREKMDVAPNYFNQYRKRLLQRGLCVSQKFGYIGFALPFFCEFVQENYF